MGDFATWLNRTEKLTQQKVIERSQQVPFEEIKNIIRSIRNANATDDKNFFDMNYPDWSFKDLILFLRLLSERMQKYVHQNYQPEYDV